MNEFALKFTMIEMTEGMVDICLNLLIAFFGIAFVWNLFNSFLKTGNSTSLSSIFSLFISAFLIILYIPVVNISLGFTQAMADLFPSPDIGVLWSNTWTEWMGAAWSFLKGENWNILQKIVAGNGTYLIKKIIEYMQLITIGILVVVGPLALLMDILPIFKGTAIKWLLGLIIVGMWSVTMGILDQFFYSYLNLYSSATPHYFIGGIGTPFGDAGMVFHTIICCVFMLLYFLVPFITTLWIGRSDAASLGGKAFSIAALGTAIAIRGATMGVSAMSTAPAAIAKQAVSTANNNSAMGTRPDTQAHNPAIHNRSSSASPSRSRQLPEPL